MWVVGPWGVFGDAEWHVEPVVAADPGGLLDRFAGEEWFTGRDREEVGLVGGCVGAVAGGLFGVRPVAGPSPSKKPANAQTKSNSPTTSASLSTTLAFVENEASGG